MSLLDDFMGGFTGSLGQQMGEKRAAAEARVAAKAQLNARLAEMREAANINAKQRKAELNDEREGEGYNPQTGLVEWVTRGGTLGSRKATAAEIAAYEASKTQSARQQAKDELDAEYRRSQINKNNRWTPGGGQAEERPLSMYDAMQLAMAELGATEETPEVRQKAAQIFNSGVTRSDLQSRPAAQATSALDSLGPLINKFFPK